MSRNEEFEELRPLLFSIAHEILGSEAEAEHTVHEAWLRYEAAPTPPPSSKAFLSAEVIRISTGLLHSAPPGRGMAAGPRPFEPLMSDADQGSGRPVEPTESLSAAAALLLERLSPLERAVFVMREVFRCSPSQIASAVGCSEEACGALAAPAPRASDGRRAVPWPRRIAGAQNVARLLAAMVPALVRVGVTMESRQVNHGPGAVFRDRYGTVLSAMALDIYDGRVQMIRWVIHPNTAWSPEAGTPPHLTP
ncbi:sigma factor-like helix-turn-helix DNA-binding protein [Streptomyces sp. NPDC002814]